MRVAILKSRLNHLGGLEKYTLRLTKAFQEAGCDVTILTTGEPKLLQNVDVISLARTTKFSLSHYYFFNKKCEEYLKAHPFDVVFGMERTAFQTHYRAGSGVHRVYLKQRKLTDSVIKRLTFTLNPLHRYILNLEKKAFESPFLKVLFTNSEMVKKEILENYKTSENKISVIHNGVEWNEWEGYFKESIQKKKEGPFHFLFVGNGYRRKGLHFLLNGLSLLKNREFIVTVVGDDKKPYLFEKEAERLGLKKQVRFAGVQKNIYPFYQQADVLVIPSIYDPFANVTVEALAMGLFIVSSKFNGGHEVLKDGTGTVIKNLTSPQSIAESLELALSHPKTMERAGSIRSSIKDLDFSNQLAKMVQQTLA